MFFSFSCHEELMCTYFMLQELLKAAIPELLGSIKKGVEFVAKNY
jgi:hypothetical protein